MDLQIGSTLGDYQVIGILGAGGMGKVYKVRNVISDRLEAMKVLLPDLANQPELADRFLREIKVQASLEHPNIASLHTAVRAGNQLLMLMEFVEGMTLEQALKNGPLPMAEAVDYIGQVLSALGYAHQHGVIHRDIKPANMMLTPAGVVKLMDFGIAKASSDHKLTMTGTTMGSLYYMSPEQIQGAANLDARADLYSVGVSLYELVTGKRPFDGDSQFAIMSAHLEKTPVPPVTLDPRLPQDLNDVILLSVAKDPNERFQTAAAFRNALGNALPARPAITQPMAQQIPPQAAAAVAQAAPQVRPAQPPARSSKRGLWMAIGALATAAIVIAAIQFGPWKGAKAGPPATPRAVQQTPQPPVAASPQPQILEQPATAAAPAAAQPTPPAATPLTTPVTTPSTRAATGRGPGRAAPQQQPVQQAPSQYSAQPPSVMQSSLDSTPPAQPPVQQPVQQPAQQQPQQPAVNRAELQQARDKLVMLSARSSGIHGSMQSMQRTMAASGMNLSSKYTEPAALMDSYMQGAHDALNANDAAGAKDMMDKAERQIMVLERLFNR